MATPYQDRPLKIEPEMNVGDDAYFHAAADGKLLIKKCGTCHKYHHYPRALCPYCFSPDVFWTEAGGAGTIYSCSVLGRADSLPHCIAYVELDEGPRMLTNIVDCDLDTVKIGQRVRITFKMTVGGVSLPMFIPA